jgi:hypothetical protein
VNAIDTSSSFTTSKLECILENYSTTRAQLRGEKNELFDIILNSMKSQHGLLLDRYIQKYSDVKKGYDVNIATARPKTNVRKRAWSDFDFLEDIPIIGHFYEILKSPSENRKLKEHLQIFTAKFVQFSTHVKSEMISSRKFKDEILQIVDAGFEKIFKDIQGLKCDIASMALLTVFQQTLKIHKAKLDELFYATRHGKLTASLPQTLSLEDLNLILDRNPKFHDTLYVSHPEILYRVGNLYLMEVQETERFLLFHFLLTSPRLKPASLFKTYYPIQVPIATEDSQLCFKPEIPTTIIIQDNNLVAADITDCTITDDLILCQQDFGDTFSPNVKDIPCLNNEPSACSLKNVPCETTMLFTKAGALVFSKNAILGMKVGESTQLTVLNKDNQFSYFFSWANYKMIQSNQKVMYSLDNELVVKNLTWKTEQISVDFRKYIKLTANEQIATNISNLRTKIGNLTSLTNMDLTPDFLGMGVTRKDWMNFTSMFSFITTVISILVVIGVCCYNRVKKSNRAVKLIMETLQQDRKERRMIKFSRSSGLMEEEAIEELVVEDPNPTSRVTYATQPTLRCTPKLSPKADPNSQYSKSSLIQKRPHSSTQTTRYSPLTEEIPHDMSSLPTHMSQSIASQTEEILMKPASSSPTIKTRQVTDAYGSF